MSQYYGFLIPIVFIILAIPTYLLHRWGIKREMSDEQWDKLWDKRQDEGYILPPMPPCPVCHPPKPSKQDTQQ